MCVTELEFTVLSLPLLYGFRKCKQRAGIEDKIHLTVRGYKTVLIDQLQLQRAPLILPRIENHVPWSCVLMQYLSPYCGKKYRKFPLQITDAEDQNTSVTKKNSEINYRHRFRMFSYVSRNFLPYILELLFVKFNMR